MSEKRFHIERDSTNTFSFFYDMKHRLYDEEVVNLLNEQTVEIEKLTKERNNYKSQIKQKNDKIERLQKENNHLKDDFQYYMSKSATLETELLRLRKENTALDNENAEHLADNIRELELLEKLTKFLHECGLTDEQRALFRDMITEEDLQPNLEVEK